MGPAEELELELVIDLDKRIDPIHFQLYNYTTENRSHLQQIIIDKKDNNQSALFLLGNVYFM